MSTEKQLSSRHTVCESQLPRLKNAEHTQAWDSGVSLVHISMSTPSTPVAGKDKAYQRHRLRVTSDSVSESCSKKGEV